MAAGCGDVGADDVDLDRRTEKGPRPRSFAAMGEDCGAGYSAPFYFSATSFWNCDRIESLSRGKIQRRLQEFPRRFAIAPGFIAKRKNRIRCRRRRFQNG